MATVPPGQGGLDRTLSVRRGPRPAPTRARPRPARALGIRRTHAPAPRSALPPPRAPRSPPTRSRSVAEPRSSPARPAPGRSCEPVDRRVRRRARTGTGPIGPRDPGQRTTGRPAHVQPLGGRRDPRPNRFAATPSHCGPVHGSCSAGGPFARGRRAPRMTTGLRSRGRRAPEDSPATSCARVRRRTPQRPRRATSALSREPCPRSAEAVREGRPQPATAGGRQDTGRRECGRLTLPGPIWSGTLSRSPRTTWRRLSPVPAGLRTRDQPVRGTFPEHRSSGVLPRPSPSPLRVSPGISPGSLTPRVEYDWRPHTSASHHATDRASPRRPPPRLLQGCQGADRPSPGPL
ncbi:hypothetical protein TLA_TLA_00343 [Tessaracoccus lapidicaptus]|nr:hypothetical protein TLA_TLA_00343 [Tessaracoccus lapidicaptus]